MGSVFGVINEEKPAHILLKAAPRYEIRRYPKLILATTNVEEGDTSTAFRSLAGYIGVLSSPQNKGRGTSASPEAMAMTAPVFMKPREPEAIAMTAPVFMKTSQMSFVLPSKYALDEVPEPISSKITISETPEKIYAVCTFAGTLEDSNVKGNLRTLLADLQNETEYKIVNDENGNPLWQFAGYNSPFTIPAYRTNEVFVEVSEASS